MRSPRRHRPGCFYKKNRQRSRFGLKSGEFALKKSTHQARTAANNSKTGPEISPGIICSQRRFALAAQASSGLLFIKKHANSAVFVPNQSICFKKSDPTCSQPPQQLCETFQFVQTSPQQPFPASWSLSSSKKSIFKPKQSIFALWELPLS